MADRHWLTPRAQPAKGSRLLRGVTGTEALAFAMGEEVTDTIRWNDDPNLPALVPLNEEERQALYLYVATPTDDGEYPVVWLTHEPDFYIAYASVAHAELAVKGDKSQFTSLLAQAKARNKTVIAQEGWFDRGSKEDTALEALLGVSKGKARRKGSRR